MKCATANGEISKDKFEENSFVSLLPASSSNVTDQRLTDSTNLTCDTCPADCIVMSSEFLGVDKMCKSEGQVNMPVELPCDRLLNNSAPSHGKSEMLEVCEPNTPPKEISSVVQKPGIDSAEKSSHELPQTEVSNEDTGFPAFFDGLVSVGKFIPMKGLGKCISVKSCDSVIQSPSLVSPLLLKEPDKFPPRERDPISKNKDFFSSTAGEILLSLGLSRVTERYHEDMTRKISRLMENMGTSDLLQQELERHRDCYSQAKKANEHFSQPLKHCDICNFATESAVVLEGHRLIPHVTPRREYRFECNYCTFESNSKVKFNSHIRRCQEDFDGSVNQAPPKDYEFPTLTPKPATFAVLKNQVKYMNCMQGDRRHIKTVTDPDSYHQHLNQISGKLNKRNTQLSQNMPLLSTSPHVSENLNIQNPIVSPRPPVQLRASPSFRPAHSNSVSHILQDPPLQHLPPNNQSSQVVINPHVQKLPVSEKSQRITSSTLNSLMYNPRRINRIPYIGGNSQRKTSPTQNSLMCNPRSVNCIPYVIGNSQKMKFCSNLYGSAVPQQQVTSRPSEQSVSVIPAPPKLQGPYPAQLNEANFGSQLLTSRLVICEICDGYLKDLEDLCTHMQRIHKVEVDPKKLVRRPPLNCEKCQWRFFTDQGLERHLLCVHGLVTSNMQELSNKRKDGGCCAICGWVCSSELAAHINRIHKMVLEPVRLSYKCAVCSDNFHLFSLFENHVTLVHSRAEKRPSVSNNTSPRRKIAKFSFTDFTSSSKGLSGEENEDARKQTSLERGCEENNCISIQSGAVGLKDDKK